MPAVPDGKIVLETILNDTERRTTIVVRYKNTTNRDSSAKAIDG